jgi:hypothetical protein
MSYRGLPALLILCLAGCAAPQPPVAATTAAAATPGPECERSYRVGSNIPTYNCAPKQSEEERQQMINEWEHAVTPKGKIGTGS